MSDREDRLELVSRLEGLAPTQAAIEEVAEQRKLYEANLGRTILAAATPVDQRDVDYKRGFFRGANWALAVLPKKAGQDLQKAIEAALKERDSE